MPINNGWIKKGGLLVALAVALGSFNTQHFVQQYGTNSGVASELARSVADIDKAILFQMVHGLAIVLVGILMVLRPGRLLRFAANCFLWGSILFSSLTFVAAFSEIKWTRHLTMVAIAILVAGWIMLVEGACPGWNKKEDSPGNSNSSEKQSVSK